MEASAMDEGTTEAMAIDHSSSPSSTSEAPSAYEFLEEARTALEEIVAKMLFVKKESKSKSELRELITQASLHFLSLRQANRAILLEEDRVKSETESARVPVDFTTLQLHNLMYEKNHYLKAIKACKDFKSKFPDIDLVPEEEFFANAPEDIKRNALSNDGAHDLMLKRLSYELLQRKELCKLREKLELHKKSLLDSIAARKKFLSTLPSHLKALKKASLPVQQQLGMQHTKKLKQQRAAELLPPPLYIVYSQLFAQKEAFAEKIEIEILGSVKDAQTFAVQQSIKESGIAASVENNKVIEDEILDDDDDNLTRRKHQKKGYYKDDTTQVEMFQSHPLNITLDIFNDEESDTPLKLLTLKFEYLVKLNIVCVGIEGAREESGSDILCSLFPDDTGIQLPHQTAKAYARDDMAFDENRSSRPYKWAQHLAGIDILPDLSPTLKYFESSSSETFRKSDILSGLALYRRQNRVQTLLQRIRSRKKAQVALQSQLDSLANLKWPSLGYENVPWTSHSPVCVLQQCSRARPASHDHASFFTSTATEQATDSMEFVVDGRSGVSRDESENAREDGELPSAILMPAVSDDIKLASSKISSHLEHCRSLALIAKSSTPTGKGKPLSSGKHDFDLELLLDGDSDSEQQCSDNGKEDLSAACSEPVKLWEEYGSREFHLILSRQENDRTLNLHAKIKISVEYPLRPPLFSLSLSTEMPNIESRGNEKNTVQWYNELRAMEAEVNLHILKILPPEYEVQTLAHQVCCLAMLYDLQFDQQHVRSDSMKNSILDVGLCKPVTGNIIARPFRGRDRRKIFSWKDMERT